MEHISNNHTKCIACFQVPRVFINGQCIGGGDETLAAENRGNLKQLLASINQGTCTRPEAMHTASVANDKQDNMPASPECNSKPGAMYHARKQVEIKPSTQVELAEAQNVIETKINSKKVMVFSKSFCPFCKKAKQVFMEYVNNGDLSEDDYEVMEIQGREDLNAIQNQLKIMTGARSVSLFIMCVDS
jgi:glutaredoxin 3